MKVALRALSMAVAFAVVPSARAANPPSVQALVTKMRAAVWPPQASLRKLTLTITAESGDPTKMVAGQARKGVDGKGRMLTVLQSPDGVRGIAWLVQEGADQTVQWVWEPYVRRVRKVFPVDGNETFAGSDFTYGDLGLVDLHSTYKLLGTESHGGVRAYKIEEVPRSRWNYARIVTWIAADTSFPLERNFYDAANALWKVERFEEVTDIGGVPTVLRRRMEDRQTGASTVIDVSEVRYGPDVPDSIFDPAQLSHAIERSWN